MFKSDTVILIKLSYNKVYFFVTLQAITTLTYKYEFTEVNAVLLAADVGNTSINIGLFENKTLVCRTKIASDQLKTADEYAVLFAGIFAMKKIDISDIHGAILLSVVPQLTHTVIGALGEFDIIPLVVGAGIKTGLNIRIDNPSVLGADIVANTIGAAKLAKPPFAVVDLGTATTITAVNPNGELCGCIIAPGAKLSLDSLYQSCALLPNVTVSSPAKLIGTNTPDSMNAGCVLGSALMLDGFISSLKAEFGTDELPIIATGGLSELILPLCKSKNIYCDPDLTLNGLCRLWEINKKKRTNSEV